jgi:hypothetical protein
MSAIQPRPFMMSWPARVEDLDDAGGPEVGEGSAGVGQIARLDEHGKEQLAKLNELKFCYTSHWGWIALAAVATLIALAVLPMVFAPKVAIYALCLCIGLTTLGTTGAVMALYTKLRYDHFIAEHKEALGESAEATTRLPYEFFVSLIDPYSAIYPPVEKSGN